MSPASTCRTSTTVLYDGGRCRDSRRRFLNGDVQAVGWAAGRAIAGGHFGIVHVTGRRWERFLQEGRRPLPGHWPRRRVLAARHQLEGRHPGRLGRDRLRRRSLPGRRLREDTEPTLRTNGRVRSESGPVTIVRSRRRKALLGTVVADLVDRHLGGWLCRWRAPSVDASATVGDDPVIAAVGGVACDLADPKFNGGLGEAGRCQEAATSNLVVDAGYAAVLPLGDVQYDCGGFDAFTASYDPTWGRVKTILHPTPGNHEYLRTNNSDGTDCARLANAGGTSTTSAQRRVLPTGGTTASTSAHGTSWR